MTVQEMKLLLLAGGGRELGDVIWGQILSSSPPPFHSVSVSPPPQFGSPGHCSQERYFTSERHVFFFFFFINLSIYFWLCWVFVSVRHLSLVAASGGHSSSRCAGLSLSRPLLLWSTGSRHAGSVVVAHGPSCSAACGIFPDQGLNPCPLHWQADSQPLHHQGSPDMYFLLNIIEVVDLQYYVNFFCTAKGLSYTYNYTLFHILFHYGIAQGKTCIFIPHGPSGQASGLTRCPSPRQQCALTLEGKMACQQMGRPLPSPTGCLPEGLSRIILM